MKWELNQDEEIAMENQIVFFLISSYLYDNWYGIHSRWKLSDFQDLNIDNLLNYKNK